MENFATGFSARDRTGLGLVFASAAMVPNVASLPDQIHKRPMFLALLKLISC